MRPGGYFETKLDRKLFLLVLALSLLQEIL
uniref:Uncharacterized protein n=1 Tax=Arundo donax TaxID=35708 RepID=A0A0A9AVL4_ARUDO